MAQSINPFGVPGRKDKWGIEDEISGHFRRYNRKDLIGLLIKSGLTDVKVWSVNVPISNLLYGLSNLAIRRSGALTKKNLSRPEQTKISGFKDTPYKTMFPGWFRFLLNRYTMYPFSILQRFFYKTGLGLVLIGSGHVDNVG